MRLLLVSRTFGPAKNLVRVAQAALDRGHEAAAVLSKDAGAMVVPEALLDFKPSILLASTSGSNVADEIAVFEGARSRHIPFTVFSDTYGTYLRPQFSEALRQDCRALFVPDAVEKEIAEKAGFGGVVASGVPLWEEFGDLVNYPTREEMRITLGIKESEAAIFYPLDKDLELNQKSLREIYQALAELARSRSVVFLPRFHPGDPNLKSDPHCYEVVLSECPVRVVRSEQVKKTENLLPAVDLVISSFSTLGITAIYRRQAVVEYLTPGWQEKLEKLIQRCTWPPSQCGASFLVTAPDELTAAMSRCLINPSLLLQAQERYYPLTQGGAALKIVETLEKLAVSS